MTALFPSPPRIAAVPTGVAKLGRNVNIIDVEHAVTCGVVHASNPARSAVSAVA